jgi:hypothetical protein
MSESYDKLCSLKTPAIYHRERVFFTDLIDAASARHWFGGHFDLDVMPPGQHALHRIVTLDLTDPRLGITAPENLAQLPLVYGLRVEACAFTYVVPSPRQIRIKHDWEMTATEDWPYPNYPDVLPRLGLRLREPVPSTLDSFGEYTHQGLDFADPDEMIVIVPSIEDYGGVSLHGEHGSGVQIIFYFTMADRTVDVVHQID